MSRINTNVTSLVAQRVLNMQNNKLYTAMQRLSTGLRINSGKDDPSGLIASEAMRTEMRAVGAAQANVGRAINVVAVAEAGLSEMGSLLMDLENLVDRSANESGISDDERTANQAEIDNILESINRIANSTELQGRKLLGGDLAYTTSTVSAANIARLMLNSVRIPDGGTRAVAIDVTQAASMAVLTYAGGSIGATPVTIAVTGNLGTERITFASASVANIKDAINQSTELTGVIASGTSTALKLYSAEFGSEEFVRVRVLSGTWGTMTVGAEVSDTGQDVTANINGQSITGSGLDLSVRTSFLDADLSLTAAFGSVITGGTTRFGATGGGARFMISPRIDTNGQATIGISALDTTQLGDLANGLLYSLGSGETNELSTKNFSAAQRIVRASQLQIATLRGRLGSFERNTLATTADALSVQYENLASAESSIRDADFATETSTLTRQQILVQSGSMVLKLANSQPQQVLTLLQ